MLIIFCLTHGLSRENFRHQFFSLMYMWALRFILKLTGNLKPYLLKCKLALSFRSVYHFDLVYVVTEILIFLSYFHAIEDFLS